jgi:DNA-binding transcriptional LysR family regulator
MTLRQCEYLIAVVEEGSFTEAAQRLLVAQPSLSRQIKVLEESIGGPLLERGRTPVRPTPLGEAFLPHANAVVQGAQEATRAARAAGRLEEGELWISTLQSIALGVVPQAIRVWRRRYPGVDIRIREYTHIDELSERMWRGDADVAIGPEPERWRGERRSLGWEEFMVVLPFGDPDLPAPGRKIDLRRLAHRPWVLYTDDFGLAPVVSGACARAGFAPQAAAHARHAITALELAAAGLGPALVPGNVIGSVFASCAVRPEPPVRRKLVAFTRSSPSPAALAFIDIIVEHATL